MINLFLIFLSYTQSVKRFFTKSICTNIVIVFDIIKKLYFKLKVYQMELKSNESTYKYIY